MPILHWVGKDKVVNHHYDVPFRLLKKQYSFQAKQDVPKNSTNNRIIHGDNLEALKSLLPEFEGKINFIYIDPPYNTGNESWVYNDNVNDPKIKKWLGQVVGKEGEDLSRHDKWLCMMYPRLKLLHRLLADDGAIFISIDDNEHSNLKLMMDEIFGGQNYLTSFVWKRRSGSNDAKNFLTVDHEYVLAYQKSNKVCFNGCFKDLSKYKNPDNDPRGAWAVDNLTCNKTKYERPNLFYSIIDPVTHFEFQANPNRVWVYEKDRMLRLIEENKVIFPKTKNGTPQYKRHLSELRNLKKPVSSWIFPANTKDKFIGICSSINSIATKELQDIFQEQVFDYPKPMNLIKNLIDQITNRDSIVLDSFSGTATTAHAVLKLNAEDGGNRQFICIEMMNYAETITAERVRRVIEGYGEDNKAVAGLGGGFDFYTVDEPLFLEGNKDLNEEVGVEAIRDYVAYTENLPPEHRHSMDNAISSYSLGLKDTALYLFYYEKERITTLDMAFLGSLHIKQLPTKPENYIIYADKCALDKDFMLKHGITFKRIPRDISRF